jgi:predicted ATPase/class 3 adenylate cyclase
MRIRLLGDVGATSGDGRKLHLGPAKCQTVLAALALSAGSAVPVWRLIELVWGEEPPRTATRTLQSHLARLHRTLGAGSIVRSGNAYRLAVAPDAVDALRFQRHLDAGETQQALAEWKGLPLAGITPVGLAPVVDGLIEQWLGAIEDDLALRVERDATAAIGQLTELTARYPLREGLWALLMTALYRVGRQGDALRAYRDARQQLADQIGVEPGPRLREVRALILDQDEKLGDAGPTKARSARGKPTGTVTFAFSEVVEVSRSWAAHRDEMAEAMARYHRVVDTAARRHGGHVFATTGDSFGLAFHSAADAASWAEDLHAALTHRSLPDLEIRVRIGLHTGDAVEWERGYYGPPIHVATRLAAEAHPGQIVLSGATASALDRDDLRHLGRHRLHGVQGRHHLYQLGDGRHPPLRIEEDRSGNLPLRLGRLIGREPDLDVVSAAMVASPVVTLVGSGGVGKTRLALAAAHRVAVEDGTWVVDLAEITSAEDVVRAVAGVLGIREGPGPISDRILVSGLRSRRMLLVLDNCEHVVDGVTRLAQTIAERCPEVTVLATSRVGLGLGLGYERLVAVGPLDPAGAGRELFNERASAVAPGFDPAASRVEVEEICRRLDGIPLAIELAAARTASLTPTDLLDRLDDHLRLLVSGRRAGAERHRTLRATVQWSYDLLTPLEQRLLRRLSIFAGPFDLAAAETVASDAELDTHAVDDRLGDLVDCSMLTVESGPFSRRFRLLETIRQFASEHLAGEGETAAVAERHASWCLNRLDHIEPILAGPSEVIGVAHLDEIWPNLRAAFEWACAAGDRDLAYALVRPVVSEIVRRSRNEIGDWVERILTLTPPSEEKLVSFGLLWAAQRYKLSSDPDAYRRLASTHGEPDLPVIHLARASAEQDYAAMSKWAPVAVADLRRQGEHNQAEQFELDIAAGFLFTGQFEQSDAVADLLIQRYRADGPPSLLNWALMLRGYSALLQQQDERAEELLHAALQVEVPERTHSPNKPLEARALFRSGDRTRAFRILGEQVETLLATRNLQAVCVSSLEFINMMAEVGRLEDAARQLGYLDATAPYWRPLVANARIRIMSDLGQAQPDAIIGDGQALEHMIGVLRALTTARTEAPS